MVKTTTKKIPAKKKGVIVTVPKDVRDPNMSRKIVNPYLVSVLLMGRKYSASGPTVSEALSGIQIRNARGKSIVVVERGDQRKERILMPIPTMRLFNSAGTTKEIALKNTSTLFDGI